MDCYTNSTFQFQKGRGLGSRDPILKFWNPLITFEWIEISASNTVHIWKTDAPCVRTIKPPQSRRGRGHVTVTQFRNFVTPFNFRSNRAMHFKFGTDVEDGRSLRTDHKTTPKCVGLGSRDPFLKFWDSVITLERSSYPHQIWLRHRGRTLSALK